MCEADLSPLTSSTEVKIDLTYTLNSSRVPSCFGQERFYLREIDRKGVFNRLLVKSSLCAS